jgi:hypothetical protein
MHAMKLPVISATFLLLTISIAPANTQVVVIGKDGKAGPPPGDPEYCEWVEPLRPNLVLKEDAIVRGRVTDQTTAPLTNSPIELRRFISESKQETIKKVSTDSDGKFSLGKVKRGEYRLLLSPHRGFQQPAKLECSSTSCAFETILIINPTDQFASSCPIR